MKILVRAIIFALILGCAYWFKLSGSERLAVTVDVQGQLDSAAESVVKTGKETQVCILASDGEQYIVSPPYAKISDLPGLAFGTASRMQTIVDAQETGHLFYLKNGELAGHYSLIKLIEPVISFSDKSEITFNLSRNKSSGRPVLLEILNP